MLLWIVAIFTLISASAVLFLTLGPLRAVPTVRILRVIAALQFLAAFLMIGARLAGRA